MNARLPLGVIVPGSSENLVHQAIVAQAGLDLLQVQADEIRVKARSTVVWMGLAMMVSTRLWLGGVVSQTRDTRLADRLLQQVRACCLTACELLICTDGWAAYVRRFGIRWIALSGMEGESNSLQGQLTHLASKDTGENSLSVKRLNPKIWRVTHRKSCTQGKAWIG